MHSGQSYREHVGPFYSKFTWAPGTIPSKEISGRRGIQVRRISPMHTKYFEFANEMKGPAGRSLTCKDDASAAGRLILWFERGELVEALQSRSSDARWTSKVL